MNGVSILADTNAIIYLLDGNESIRELFSGKDIYLSSISEIEILSFPGLSAQQIKTIRSFIAECSIIELTSEIKEAAIFFRTSYKLKLPDAIIAASAFYLNIPIFTADKSFKKISELEVYLLNLQ
jgi:predicted nucleic acid-binding protein